MASNLPVPLTTSSSSAKNLFAAMDMGTNSIKLLLVRADPSTGRFVTFYRLKEAVVLGRDTTSISSASQLRAIDALRKFQRVLHSHRIPVSHSRLVATSAVREASNQSDFLRTVHQTLGFVIDVLSGYEEARLIYLGVLQFHPVHNNRVLTIDIGGGSTEFVIGKEGEVLFGTSLKLGHVTLTQEFVNDTEIQKMREHIKSVIQASGLVENVKEHGVDIVIGSSGTIRSIEKAVFFGYASDFGDNLEIFEGHRREWRFTREELGRFVERLCFEEGGRVRREGFFKKRSEFIVAGAVLLEEIFGMLGIEEMQVSGFALGEGVIAEKLAEVFDGYDLNANARWRSLMWLSKRFNNTKRMKSAALCAGIAKDIFEGLRKWNEENNFFVTLDEKYLEYLEAACLLHNIGLFTGKKGYQKQSYRIIMHDDHLHGYGDQEVKIIALLVRHHRKKFPNFHHASLDGFTEKIKEKFIVLCAIIRISAVLQKFSIQGVEFSHSHKGFKLVLNGSRDWLLPHVFVHPVEKNIEAELEKELEHFRMIFQQKLSIVVPSSTSE